MLPEVASTIVPPGSEQAARLRVVDHRERDPVLDAAAGVEPLELGEDARRAAGEVRELDERSAADRAEQRRGIGAVVSTGESFAATRLVRR